MTSDDYRAWNAQLAEHFFGASASYHPVYLDVDEDVLRTLARDTADPVDAFVSAIRPTLAWNGTISFVRHHNQIHRWRSSGRQFPPPFIAVLGLFVLAANRMHSSGDFRATNYYMRLAELVEPREELHTRTRNRLSILADDMSAIWDELNSWLQHEAGVRGIPTARSFGSKVHVSRHISQALLRQHDRQILHGLFAEAGLEAGSSVRPREMRELLEGWALLGRVSHGLAALLEQGEAAEPITAAALDLLLEWDGEDPRSDSGGSRNTGRQEWRLVVRRRHRPARPPAFEARFVGKPHPGGPVQLALDGHVVEAEVTRRATGEWVEIDFSLPLEQIPRRAEIRASTGQQYQWSAPDTLLLGHDPEEFLGFVQTSRIAPGERYLVLHRAGTPMELDGMGPLPSDPEMAGAWNVYRDVEAVASGREPLLRFEGGARLPGHGIFHVSAPPTIAVLRVPARAQLVIEYASERGRSHRSFELDEGADARIPVADGRAERGQYIVRLLAAGEGSGSGDLRVVSQASFRLTRALAAPAAFMSFPGYDLEAAFGPGKLSELPREPAGPFIRGAEAVARTSTSATGESEASPCESGRRRWWRIDLWLKYPTRPIEETLNALVCPECGRSFRVTDYRRSPNRLIRVWGSCNPGTAVKVSRWHRGADPEDEATDDVSVSTPAVDYERLLDGVSLLGSGDMVLARRLLGESGREPGALVGTNSCLLFESLGHMEIERDRVHFKPVAWHVAPPILSQVMASDCWVLTGYRSADLVETIERCAGPLEVAVTRQAADGIPVVMLQASSNLLMRRLVDEVKSELEIDIKVTAGPASTALIDALPGTDELVDVLPRALSPPFDVARWNPLTDTWAVSDREDVLARISEMPSLYVVTTPIGPRHVDVRLGKYIAARLEGVTLLRYDRRLAVLSVPTGSNLPSLYERAAVLASGMPPVQDLEWIRYRFVPASLATSLARKLGMELEEDESE